MYVNINIKEIYLKLLELLNNYLWTNFFPFEGTLKLHTLVAITLKYQLSKHHFHCLCEPNTVASLFYYYCS